MNPAATAISLLPLLAYPALAQPVNPDRLTQDRPTQDRPPPRPTRDVDVSYRSEQAGQVIEQRSRFAATAQRMRLDTATPGLYMLVDYRTNTMSLVSDPDRGAVDMPVPATGPNPANPALQTAPPGTAPGPYIRRGQDQVAGLPCTEWEVKDTRGQPTLSCFTADGVMLRARYGAQIIVIATRVAYGPMNPTLFDVPPGYGHVGKRAAP